MDQHKRFAGRTAIVTGGAGSIGLAVAKRLAREGAGIALVDVDGKALTAAGSEVEALGTPTRSYVCDVSDRAAVARMVSTAVKDFGRVDLLFNNAGYQGLFAPVHLYPEDDFDRVLRINVAGAFYVLRAVGAHMTVAGGGAIVNTASMAGVGGPPNMIAYGASKFAMVGMTQSAAKDLAPHRVRVNAISPAFMGPGVMWDRQVAMQAAAHTQYFSEDPDVVAKQMIGSVPMRRVGSIDEIPGTVAFLLSDDASYITGVNIPISGGILG